VQTISLNNPCETLDHLNAAANVEYLFLNLRKIQECPSVWGVITVLGHCVEAAASVLRKVRDLIPEAAMPLFH